MRTLVTLLERTASAGGYLAALLAVPLIAAICYEVFARYLFGAPTIWAYELGYSLAGSQFVLGAALTLRRRGHVRIDLVYARLRPRARAAIDLVFYACFLTPFLGLVCNALIGHALSAYETGERSGQSAWNPPIWPFRAALAAGFVLLLLQVLAEILKTASVLRGRPLAGSGEG